MRFAREGLVFEHLRLASGVEQPSTAVRDGDLKRKCRKPMAPNFRIACVRSGMESRLIWGWVGA